MAAVEFEPVGHVYRVAGRRVPAVSNVLERAGQLDGLDRVPADVLALGTDVHATCAAWDRGESFAFRAIVAGYLAAWQAWTEARRPTWTAIEVPLTDGYGRFAGTPDRVGKLAGGDVAAWDYVVDLKTEHAGPAAPLQLAAYARLASGRMAGPCLGWRRLVVVVRADGTFREVEHGKDGDYLAWDAALALATWRWSRDVGMR